MVTCEKVQKYPAGFTTESLLLYVMVMHNHWATDKVFIGESLSDSIQRGRGRGGRGYMDKYITHKHQGKGVLFSPFGKLYGM